MNDALLSEQASPGQLRVFTFDPGDGTLYRAVFASFDEATGHATYISLANLFFAFGVGNNRPVTGYFFSRRHAIDFGSFWEKMHGCANGYPTTVYMAWCTLLILLNRDLPEHLPHYSDVDEPPQGWYESLADGWIDTVRQGAGLM